MTKPSTTYQELIAENVLLKQKIDDLEQLGSEHKRIEEKLRESENWLRTIVEGTHALLVSVDINGHFTYTNDATARAVGYASSEELIGKSYLHFVHPDDRQCVLDTFTNQVSIFQPSSTQEFRIIDTKGNVKWFSFLSTLAIQNGQVVGQSGVAQDITDRKQAEEALRKSEEKYRTILEKIDDGYFELTLTGSLTFFNDSFCQIWGYPKNELLGMNYRQYTDADNAKKLFRAFRKVFNTGKSTKEFDWQILSKNGTKKHVETSVSLLNSSADKPQGFKGIVRDITKRKRAEKLLRESQRHYKLLAENVDDIIWTMNAELTHYTYVSPSIAKLGYTSIEFISQPFDAFIAPKYLEYIQKAVSERLQKELAGKGDNSPGRWEMEFLKKNGETIYVESLTRILRNENGLFQGLLGVTRDITERKRTEEALRESEERYQSILKASPDNITITDIEGRILMISPAGLTMFGYDSEGEVIGNMVFDHLVPEDRDRALTNLALKSQGVLSGPDEYQGLHKNGSAFDIEVMSNFMRDYAGRPTGVVIVSRDIAERKQVEEERKKMQAQLQQAQKMEAIGTLAGGIAHDFNNILGAILGYAEMAREDCPPESIAASDLNEVILASNRAKDLVKQILAFSRQTEAKKIPLRPAAIVKEAIILLRSSIPSIISFQQDIDSEASLILADSTQFHQIIINLCTNAYHAMEETGGTLSISLKNTTLTPQDLMTIPSVQPGYFVQLSISDTGSGIAPEILEKMFHPYFTTKETGKGTGMGLAIVHGIVKSSGGFITCNSEVGAGTVFKIYLPAFLKERVPETQEVNVTPLGTERILFIDDEETLTRMAQRFLEKLGYSVTAQMDSLHAFVTFNEQPYAFDMVITDQTMPGMTGFDLARKILRIRPGMPIILCTGYSDQVSEEKARTYGIKGFAMKPLAGKDIAIMIRRILDEGKNIS